MTRAARQPDSGLELLVDALACYRLTRLATADTIFDEPRGLVVRWAYEAHHTQGDLRDAMAAKGLDADRLAHWPLFAQQDDDTPKLATLVTCRWCAGVWCAAAVLAARTLSPRLWRWAARGLAVAAAGALVAGLEKD